MLSVAVANGPEFQVNTYTTNDQYRGKVASDTTGDYVIVWFDPVNTYGVYGQRYNAQGTAEGSNFRVNTTPAGQETAVDVAMDAQGDFVVTWDQLNGVRYSIYAQRYSSVGLAQGSNFVVNSNTSFSATKPAVAMDASGDFVVAWTSYGDQDGNGSGVFAERYNGAGTSQGNEFRVNTYTTGKQQQPTVAIDAAGDFVVAWQSYGQDGSGYGIYAQRYNSSGTAQGGEFKVNTYTAGAQIAASIAMDEAGDFDVAWQSGGQDGSFYGIYDQRYSSSGTALGGEFRVNTYTTSNQSSPAVAMDLAGDFVVSWTSYGEDGSYFGIFAQRFSSTGAPQASEFLVNTYTTSDQELPAAAMDAAGDFVVAWQSDYEDGSYYGIYAQRYSLVQVSPASATGVEFHVNTYTTGNQELPKIASDAAGDYVVVWSSYHQDGSSYGIYGQRYNAAGTAQGSEFRVNTYTTNFQSNPSVAMDAAGDFVVAWDSVSEDGSLTGVYAQRYNAAGTAQGNEFRVNTYTTNSQTDPSVAMDSAGDFVVTWESYGEDGALYGIYAQLYNAAGTAQGAEFRPNVTTAASQQSPSVAMDSAGDFVIAWSSGGNQDGAGYGIYARRYNHSGVPQSGEFRVNTYTTANQQSPTVGMDSGGDFVIAWQSLLEDGSSYGVYAQQYNSSGAAQGSQFRVNTYTSSLQQSPAVAMDATGDFVVSWESNGEDGSQYGVYAQQYNSSGTVQGSEFRVNTYTTSNQSAPAVAMDSTGDFVVAWQSKTQDGSQYGIYAQRYATHTVTVNGTSNNVAVTFSDASDFTLSFNGGAATSFPTAKDSKLIYNGPSGAFSRLVFDDPFNTYAATQSFSATDLVASSFEFDANGVTNFYAYATNGSSTATVSVGAGVDSNFFVDVPGSNYSYIGDPAAGTYSELSGFVAETVTGSGGSTYAYFYSASHAAVIGNATGSSATVNGHTSTFGSFPQLYIVGASDGTDTVTLDSLGGTFVGTPNFSYVSGTSSGSSFLIGALYAAAVTAQAAGSADTAIFYSYPANTFNGAASTSVMSGSTTNAGGASYSFVDTADGYDAATVFESGAGTDVANLTSPGGGTFVGTSTVSTLTVGSSTLTVNTYFENSNSQIVAVPSQVNVTGAGTGTDSASVYDAAGSNALVASGSTATLTTSVDTITVNKFGSVTAYQQNGSHDTVHKAAIDFTLSTVGNWISV